jgi:ATP-binding protein involved in chromosome partitioning
MVRDIVHDQQRLGGTIVLTTAACPLRARLQHDAEQALAGLARVRAVEVKLGAMSTAERSALGARLREGGHFVDSLFGPGSRTRTIIVASGKEALASRPWRPTSRRPSRIKATRSP